MKVNQTDLTDRLADHYEALRQGALSDEARDGIAKPLGLALFKTRGMAEWMATWSTMTPSAPAAASTKPLPQTRTVQVPLDIGDQLASLIAQVAFKIFQESSQC